MKVFYRIVNPAALLWSKFAIAIRMEKQDIQIVVANFIPSFRLSFGQPIAFAHALKHFSNLWVVGVCKVSEKKAVCQISAIKFRFCVQSFCCCAKSHFTCPLRSPDTFCRQPCVRKQLPVLSLRSCKPECSICSIP